MKTRNRLNLPLCELEDIQYVTVCFYFILIEYVPCTQ
jgi:hypothetical protein